MLKIFAFTAAVEELATPDWEVEACARDGKYDNHIPLKFQRYYPFYQFQEDINTLTDRIICEGIDAVWDTIDPLGKMSLGKWHALEENVHCLKEQYKEEVSAQKEAPAFEQLSNEELLVKNASMLQEIQVTQFDLDDHIFAVEEMVYTFSGVYDGALEAKIQYKTRQGNVIVSP